MEQRADRNAYFMPGLRLLRIEEDLQLMERAAGWFSDKWAVPAEAYLESMEAACGSRAVPRWYLVIDEKDEIVAGAGIIDNDFHDRPELTPNLCALYVEENWRGRGIAGCLLELARSDMAACGIEKLYLVTDHDSFYERYGWRFLTMVCDESGLWERMYVADCDAAGSRPKTGTRPKAVGGELAEMFGACESPMLKACLAGQQGELITDDPKAPFSAAAVIGDFVFCGGRPDASVLLKGVQKAAKSGAGAEAEKETKAEEADGDGFRVLVPSSREWEQLIEATFGTRLQEITRRAMTLDTGTADREHLERLFSAPVLAASSASSAPAVPDAPDAKGRRRELREMDEELFSRCRAAGWSCDLTAGCRSFADFRRLGALGFVVTEDGAPVSGAASYVVFDSEIEIEIDTRHDRRRRGLARICGARLVYECLERGLYPHWDAHNIESARLASSLGYEVRREYKAYELRD